jgi:hypothetical protein
MSCSFHWKKEVEERHQSLMIGVYGERGSALISFFFLDQCDTMREWFSQRLMAQQHFSFVLSMRVV